MRSNCVGFGLYHEYVYRLLHECFRVVFTRPRHVSVFLFSGVVVLNPRQREFQIVNVYLNLWMGVNSGIFQFMKLLLKSRPTNILAKKIIVYCVFTTLKITFENS